jgi:hypothetical protein
MVFKKTHQRQSIITSAYYSNACNSIPVSEPAVRFLKLDDAPGLRERHTVDERAGLYEPRSFGASGAGDDVLRAMCP